uniref:Uncharacterized protein n=1 Tax=mine drainage metagenome TaxID=410659 RepID=E6PWN0_9ZZZZ
MADWVVIARKRREVFSGEYALSGGTTEGEAMDGACVVIAKLALWWLGDGYVRLLPLPIHAAQNAAWMGHTEWWLGWEGKDAGLVTRPPASVGE